MLARRTRLRSRTPIRRKTRIRARRERTVHGDRGVSRSRRRPPEYEDQEFIAWLERQACRVTGKVGRNVAHHLRHDANGASLGGHLKDDRRAITLDPDVHVPQLHSNAGFFKGWSKARLRAWENAQLADQRAQYLALSVVAAAIGCEPAKNLHLGRSKNATSTQILG